MDNLFSDLKKLLISAISIGVQFLCFGVAFCAANQVIEFIIQMHLHLTMI